MAYCHMKFTETFGDARIEELRVLSLAAQNGKFGLPVGQAPIGPWRDLLVALVWDGLLTNFSYEYSKRNASSLATPNPDMSNRYGPNGQTLLEAGIAKAKLKGVIELYENGSVELHLTHLGRVRLSELKQALRSGREREQFGILWDARHWQRDLQIAILDASANTPLSLVYLDMNGLKLVNDSCGHDAGDQALRTYFQAVVASIDDPCQAYRLSGDEVLVVLPNHSAQATVPRVRNACATLMGAKLDLGGKTAAISIAAGILSTADPGASPTELRSLADSVQYRAKDRSKMGHPRPSVIAIENQEEMIVLEHI